MKVFDKWNHGHWINGFEKVYSIEESDIVVLPGGSDVNPKYYGQEAIKSTWFNDSDIEEFEVVNKAVKQNKFLIGICKGAQVVNIAAGGSMIQHVNNHGGMHDIKTFDGQTIRSNSTHHQMMYPYNLPKENYELLAWTEQLSDVHITEGNKNIKFKDSTLDQNGWFKEPEIIWFPKIRGLSCQMHPEYANSPKELNDWVNKLIIEKFNT